MNKLFLFLSGLLLAVSFILPHIDLSDLTADPVPVVVIDQEPDATIVKLLKTASAADKKRIFTVYSQLAETVKKDNDEDKKLKTTEQLAELQDYSLFLAIDTPGKYPGLDKRIEAIFKELVGEEVLPLSANNPIGVETRAAVIKAAEIIAVSAQ